MFNPSDFIQSGINSIRIIIDSSIYYATLFSCMGGTMMFVTGIKKGKTIAKVSICIFFLYEAVKYCRA